MTEAGQTAIDKLSIIKGISQNGETQQICKVMIEYITKTEKEDAGFNGGKK